MSSLKNAAIGIFVVLSLPTALGVASALPPNTNAPSVVAELPSPRYFTSSVWDGHNAYVFGGETSTTQGTDQIVRFSPTTGQVTVMSAKLPSPRHGTAAAWDGKAAYVIGGYDDAAGTWLDQIVRYDPATDSIRVMNASLPSPRGHASAVWDGQSVYVLGGHNCYGCGVISQVVRYNPEMDAIVIMNATIATANEAVAVWDGLNAYILGGWTGSYSNLILKYNPAADTVTQMTSKLPFPLADAAAVWTGSGVYVFAGECFGSCSYGSASSAVVHYDPATDQASVLPPGLPSGRWGVSAVWDGQAAYVFGGNNVVGAGGLMDDILGYRLVDSCASDLYADHFGDGSWTRTDSSVAEANGTVSITPDGAFNSAFSLACTAHLPLDVTARIASGGRNYVFPWVNLRLSNGQTVTASSLPDGSHGWFLQVCDAGYWPPSSNFAWGTTHVLSGDYPGTCSQVEWNPGGPASVAEGQFMTLRVDFDGSSLLLFERSGASQPFLLAHKVPYASGPVGIEAISLQQPWDAAVEVTSIQPASVVSDGDLTRSAVLQDGEQTRAAIRSESERTLAAVDNAANLTNSSVSTEANQTRELLLNESGSLRASVDNLDTVLSDESNATRGWVTQDGNLTRQSIVAAHASIASAEVNITDAIGADGTLTRADIANVSSQVAGNHALLDGLTASVTNLTATVQDGFSHLLDAISQLSDSVATGFQGVLSRLGIMDAKLDELLASPLVVQLVPESGTVPGSADGVLMLVTEDGRPHDASLSFQLDGQPAGSAVTWNRTSQGVYNVSFHPSLGDTAMHTLLASAADGSRHGSAIALVGGDPIAPVNDQASGILNNASAAPASSFATATLLDQQIPVGGLNATTPLVHADVVRAQGARGADGNYHIAITVLGAYDENMTLPSAGPGLPDASVTLLDVPATTVQVPNVASVHLEAYATYDTSALRCAAIVNGNACVPLPFPVTQPLWLTNGGLGSTLHIRATILDGQGQVVGQPVDVDVPFAGQIVAWGQSLP